MKLIKARPEADDIISMLSKFHSENGKSVSFEVSAGYEIDGSIVLRKENKYPYSYGLVVLSSKVDNNLIGRNDIVFLGISNYPKEAIAALDADNIRYFTMRKIMNMGINEVVDLVMESAISFEKLCLSINLDVLDKAFSSDGITGGMTARELIYCVQRLKLMKNLKTVEICGENKEMIAKLLKELG